MKKYLIPSLLFLILSGCTTSITRVVPVLSPKPNIPPPPVLPWGSIKKTDSPSVVAKDCVASILILENDDAALRKILSAV